MFMKKLLGMLCVSALATAAFSQGLVIFNNTPSTLVTLGYAGNTAPIWGATGPLVGSWFFALLTSPSGLPGTFSFSGNYATNYPTAYGGPTAGRFIGGTQTVNGWAPGTTMFYEVAGWSSSFGHDWQPGWLLGNFGAASGFFGLSASASGTAGGGTPPIPAFPLFGGTGISGGFNLAPIGTDVPEPSSMTLMGFCAAVLVVFRRTIGPNHRAATNQATMFRCHAVGHLRRFVDRDR
jgi:hypothetical protein